jgi:hypothetical protein
MTSDEIVKKLENLYINYKSLPEVIKESERIRKAYNIEADNDNRYPIIDNPIRYTLDEQYKIITECLEEYKKLPQLDRELIRMSIDEPAINYISGAAGIAADICLNVPDQNVFTNGLYLIGFDYGKADLRDTWIWLAPLCDVAMRTGLSYSEYFKSGEPFVEELQKYLMRSDIKNILSAMGHKIIVDEDGTKHYKQTYLSAL